MRGEGYYGNFYLYYDGAVSCIFRGVERGIVCGGEFSRVDIAWCFRMHRRKHSDKAKTQGTKIQENIKIF